MIQSYARVPGNDTYYCTGRGGDVYFDAPATYYALPCFTCGARSPTRPTNEAG